VAAGILPAVSGGILPRGGGQREWILMTLQMKYKHPAWNIRLEAGRYGRLGSLPPR